MNEREPILSQKKSEGEKISSRERLASMEKEGKYVFHGSPDLIDVLEVRQPLKYDLTTKRNIKDGEPCVAATPIVDIAIFRAIVNPKNFPGKDVAVSRFGVNQNGEVTLATTKDVLDQIIDKKGFVYVFDKAKFNQLPYSKMEWRSDSSAKPLDVILVTADNLPKNITVIDKNFNEST